MPPSTAQLDTQVSRDTSHLLSPHKRSGVGPVVGIVIIVFVLILGAFYFWGAYLNNKNSVDQLPLIPSDSSTTEQG